MKITVEFSSMEEMTAFASRFAEQNCVARARIPHGEIKKLILAGLTDSEIIAQTGIKPQSLSSARMKYRKDD